MHCQDNRHAITTIIGQARILYTVDIMQIPKRYVYRLLHSGRLSLVPTCKMLQEFPYSAWIVPFHLLHCSRLEYMQCSSASVPLWSVCILLTHGAPSSRSLEHHLQWSAVLVVLAHWACPSRYLHLNNKNRQSLVAIQVQTQCKPGWHVCIDLRRQVTDSIAAVETTKYRRYYSRYSMMSTV